VFKYSILLVIVLSSACGVNHVSTEVEYVGMTAEQVEQSKYIIDTTVALFEDMYGVSVDTLLLSTVELGGEMSDNNNYGEHQAGHITLAPGSDDCMADTSLAHEVLHVLANQFKIENTAGENHSHDGLWYSGVGTVESVYSVEASAVIDTCDSLCPESCIWAAHRIAPMFRALHEYTEANK
jgi:hypothetical protein